MDIIKNFLSYLRKKFDLVGKAQGIFFLVLARLALVGTLTSILVPRALQAQPPRLQEVLVSELKIRMDWYSGSSDTKLRQLERLLHAFNNRLYDATDGQWRIGTFHIYDARGPLDLEDHGVGHIHEQWALEHGTEQEHGHAGLRCPYRFCSIPLTTIGSAILGKWAWTAGTALVDLGPDSKDVANSRAAKLLRNPNHFHLGFDKYLIEGVNSYAGVMLMEFLHSWTGLLDEYLDGDGDFVRGGNCPTSATQRGNADACVMDQLRKRTEFCRQANHNKDTFQEAAREIDCYRWLKRVFRESGKGTLVVPTQHVPGPTTAPLADIVNHIPRPLSYEAALMRRSNGKIYLFKGNEYARFSKVKKGVDQGFPKLIKKGWPRMPSNFNNGIDAALWRKSNGKIYLFKGNQYVRFSKVKKGVDQGYPKPIKEGWPGMPSNFNNSIDAALWRESNGKIYLFKGDDYVRFSKVKRGVDKGYPKPISGYWP